MKSLAIKIIIHKPKALTTYITKLQWVFKFPKIYKQPLANGAYEEKENTYTYTHNITNFI